MMADILEIQNAKKRFGSKEVLKGVDFSVPEHSVFGFVGQNGAGKTTTMKAILGLISLDEGDIFVDGEKVSYGKNTCNRVIGYLPDVPEYYTYMTAREYLHFCGELSGMEKKEIQSRTEEMLERVGLSEEKHRIKGYSRGMKQRLGVAQALLHRPRLLICDEPTSALDPVGRKELMDILTDIKGETTVLFSTHILSDVERICDEIAFLHQGKIVISGGMQEIRRKHESKDMEVVFFSEQDAKTFSECVKQESSIAGNCVQLKNVKEAKRQELLKIIYENQLKYENIQTMSWSLEQLFLEVAGK